MAQSAQNTAELTAEQVAKVLTKPLEKKSHFLAAVPAANIYSVAGPLRIPKAPTSEADVLTFTGENEMIPEQDYDFDELSLLPSTMKSVKVLTRFSNELARQSVVSLDAALQARMVADVALKIDGQLLSATGDGITTPRGLFAYTGTTDVAVGGAFTLGAVLDGQAAALAADVDPDASALTLFVRPEDYMAVRGQKTTDGQYLVQPNAQGGGLVVPLLGATVRISKAVPAGRAALVDMAQVAVARDVAPSVKLLDQTFADYDQMALRVVTRLDAGALNPEAVVTFSGITNV